MKQSLLSINWMIVSPIIGVEALLSPLQFRTAITSSLSANLRDYVGYPFSSGYNPGRPPPYRNDGGYVDYDYNFNPFVGDFNERNYNYVTRDNGRRGSDANRFRDGNSSRRRSRRYDYGDGSIVPIDINVPPSRSAGQLARSYSNNNYNGNSSFNGRTVVERYFEAWNLRNVPLALSCFDDLVYYDDTQFSRPFLNKDELANHLLYVVDCVPDSWEIVLDGISVGTVGRGVSRRTSRSRGFDGRNGNGAVRRSRDDDYYNYDSNNRGSSLYYDNNNSRSNQVNIAALWHVENDNGPLPYSRGCSFFTVNPNTNLITEAYDFPEPAVIKPGSTGLKLLSIASKLVDEPVRFIPFIVWTTYIYVIFFSNGILPGKDVFHADLRTWEEVRALSLNFFYISPILGMKLSPSVHPCLEAVFNTLMAWTFLFMGFLSDERTGVGSRGSFSGRNFFNSYNSNNVYDNDGVPYYEKLSTSPEEVLPDGRTLIPPVSPTKRNLVSIIPTIIGMQFLTSAYLLPYLFCRTSERSAVSPYFYENRNPRSILTRPLYKEELDKPATVVGEWRGLGIIMGFMGLLGIYWFFNGRIAEFGPPLWESPKRMQSFMKLLSIDRVGSTFLVDFVIFWCFQGWLIDDDWKRRGRSMADDQFLRNVAKFVPFWGLACYLTFRPGYPSRNDLDVDEIENRGFLNSRNVDGFFNDGGGRNDYFGDGRRNNRRRDGGGNNYNFFNGFGGGGRNDDDGYYNRRRRDEFNDYGRSRRRR